MSEAEETNEPREFAEENEPSRTSSSWFEGLVCGGIVLLLTIALLLYDFSHPDHGILFTSYDSPSSDQMNSRDEKLPDSYREISTPPPSSMDQKKGKALYEENCSSCHGVDGTGHGPVAEGLSPQPQSFKDSKFLQQHSNRYLFWRISEGKHGSAMPSFKQTLSENERWQIVYYLRVLQSN